MDIIDVIRNEIGSFLPYGSGRMFTGKCPSCGGRLVASPAVQMFKCCDCGIGGDVFDFIAKARKISYKQAKELVLNGVSPKIPDGKTEFLAVNEDACQWFQAQYKRKDTGSEARKYIEGKRKLTGETVAKFRIGFGGSSSNGLWKALLKKGWTESQLQASGLFVGTDDGKWFDRFRDRVIFPITDIYGRVIAFGGRLLSDDKDKAKYVNSPESKFFKKRENLFGLSQISGYEDKGLMLGEGYMDVIAMHQAGFTNAVASLGTSLTGYQARLIARFSPKVTIAYDSDAPGVKAATRAIGVFLPTGAMTKWFSMLPMKDPDEFIKAYGADEFRDRISKAVAVTLDEEGNLMKDERIA